jgi:iron complex transport system permease protein
LNVHVSTEEIDGIAELEEVYHHSTKRKLIFLGILFVLLTIIALVATATGVAGISVSDVVRVIVSRIIPGLHLATISDLAETVVMELRLPRIFLAMLAGLSLAGAGAVMQGVLRNPLVSPFTLGLSAGASLGAAIAIVLGTSVLGSAFIVAGKYLIVVNSFIFGSITMLLIYGIAKIKGAVPETLILAGVALGYLFQAGVSALKYFSENEALKDLVVWLRGGLWGASWNTVIILAPIVIICLVLLERYSWDLNALGSGEEVAMSLGVNVDRLRLTTLMLATLMASSTIAFTGIIGFIGLVAPHVCRFLVGSDNRFLIPGAALMGAVLLLLADTLARVVLAPVEIPVGILTSLIGAPFFLFLLLKKKQQLW